MIDFEREIAGSTIYCGIDEAGRGPLAGPVVAAAVIMPRDGKLKTAKLFRKKERFDKLCRYSGIRDI